MATGAPWGMIMDMITSLPMDDADLLRLTQWLSPAFPVGGFAYSHGLEQAMEQGDVTDAEALFLWLDDVLRHGAGLADATLLCAALAGVEAAADHARALAASRERWLETRDQGAAFTDTVAALGIALPKGLALPVAVGQAARHLSLPPDRVAALYLQAFVGNLVLVAVRFMPLGQTAGQVVLSRLHPSVLSVARQACTLSLDEITSGVPGADLAAMRHETQEIRLFRS